MFDPRLSVHQPFSCSLALMSDDEARCVTQGWSSRWGAAGRLPGRLRDCKQIFDLNFFTLSTRQTLADASKWRVNGEERQVGERIGLVHLRQIVLKFVGVFSVFNIKGKHINAAKRKDRACSSKGSGLKICYKALSVVDIEEKHVNAKLSSIVYCWVDKFNLMQILPAHA